MKSIILLLLPTVAVCSRLHCPGDKAKQRYRGSYMNAHVLLNLLNELRKRDKMRGLPNLLTLFHNEFNKFNNTGV